MRADEISGSEGKKLERRITSDQQGGDMCTVMNNREKRKEVTGLSEG